MMWMKMRLMVCASSLEAPDAFVSLVRLTWLYIRVCVDDNDYDSDDFVVAVVVVVSWCSTCYSHTLSFNLTRFNSHSHSLS